MNYEREIRNSLREIREAQRALHIKVHNLGADLHTFQQKVQTLTVEHQATQRRVDVLLQIFRELLENPNIEREVIATLKDHTKNFSHI